MGNSSNIETVNIDGFDFVVIELDENNLSKIALQIIYYKEYGYKNFLISYKFDTLKYPMTRVLSRLKVDYLFRLAKEYGFNFKFEGFSRCVYERYILKPEFRRYYENKVSFHHRESCKGNKVKREICKNCLFNDNCDGICQKYIDKFTDKEFFPLISNDALYDLNKKELEYFKDEELIRIGNILLDDFKKDKMFERKKFGYVSYFCTNIENIAGRRFIYTVHNREDDFEETYEMLVQFFRNKFLYGLKEFIRLSSEISVSFGFTKDGFIRKKFYFSISDLSIEQITILSKHLNCDIKTEKCPVGINLEFVEDSFNVVVCYLISKSTVLEIKGFAKDVNLESKRMFLRFSNSLIKPVNLVYYNYKYRDNKLFSKSMDISLKYNSYRLNQFYALFKIPIIFFEDKNFEYLNFEMKDGGYEVIGFYYTLMLPEEEDEVLAVDDMNVEGHTKEKKLVKKFY